MLFNKIFASHFRALHTQFASQPIYIEFMARKREHRFRYHCAIVYHWLSKMTPINFKAIFLLLLFLYLSVIYFEASCFNYAWSRITKMLIPRSRLSLSLSLSHWSQASKHKNRYNRRCEPRHEVKNKTVDKTKQHTSGERAHATISSGHSTLLSYCIMSI